MCFLISEVFVPVALLCALLLIDDSNRHQFACGGRRGLQITFRQWRKNKRRRGDNSRGDNRLRWRRITSPTQGEDKVARLGYSFITHTSRFFCWAQREPSAQRQELFSSSKINTQVCLTPPPKKKLLPKFKGLIRLSRFSVVG